MRSQGVAMLKTSEIELALNPQEPKRRRRKSGAADLEPLLKDTGFKGYTEEQLLAWSSQPPGAEDADDNQV